MSVVHAARAFRARLTAQDDQALAEIRDHYTMVIRAVDQRLRAVTSQLALLPPGEPAPISWLYERDRLTSFRAQVEREVRAHLPAIQAVAVAHQQAAATLAHTDALDLINQSAGTRLAHQRLDTVRAVQATGQARAEATRDLFRDLPLHAGRVAARALETGITLGQSPTVIARDMTRALGGNRARAQTIARTEALRAYRESSMETWRRDGDVSRWQWFSTLDRTACPVCWAMHGTLHPITETMGSHPSCRCTPLPVPNGTPPPIPETESGEARFERLTYSEQRDLIGPRKHDAYLDGQLRLPDLVATENHPRWGLVRRERSLRDAMTNAPSGGHGAPPPPRHLTAFNTSPTLEATYPGLYRRSMDALETAHITPPPGFRPLGITATNITSRGLYHLDPRGIEVARLDARAGAPMDPRQVVTTIHHEIGHAIDHHATGALRLATDQRHHLAPLHWRVFLNVARDTDTVRGIHAARDRYLLRPWEVWARAFQQYVAEQSDPDQFGAIIRGEIAEDGAVLRMWGRDDWPRVRRAVQAVLRREGWIP